MENGKDSDKWMGSWVLPQVLLKIKVRLIFQMSSRTILLVDDDPLIRQLGGELLEHLGFRVATA